MKENDSLNSSSHSGSSRKLKKRYLHKAFKPIINEDGENTNTLISDAKVVPGKVIISSKQKINKSKL